MSEKTVTIEGTQSMGKTTTLLKNPKVRWRRSILQRSPAEAEAQGFTIEGKALGEIAPFGMRFVEKRIHGPCGLVITTKLVPTSQEKVVKTKAENPAKAKGRAVRRKRPTYRWGKKGGTRDGGATVTRVIGHGVAKVLRKAKYGNEALLGKEAEKAS